MVVSLRLETTLVGTGKFLDFLEANRLTITSTNNSHVLLHNGWARNNHMSTSKLKNSTPMSQNAAGIQEDLKS